MVRGAQKGRKAKIESNGPHTITPHTSLGANNTKSLQEMKAFIAQMRLKYNPDGPTTASTLADNSFQSFSDKLIEHYTGLNNIASSEFIKYLDLGTWSTGDMAALVNPPTLPAVNAERQQEERTPVEDPPTRHGISNNCACSCAQVAEEAASLKHLLTEMQRQHLELRKGKALAF
jgi:hypothetical protein